MSLFSFFQLHMYYGHKACFDVKRQCYILCTDHEMRILYIPDLYKRCLSLHTPQTTFGAEINNLLNLLLNQVVKTALDLVIFNVFSLSGYFIRDAVRNVSCGIHHHFHSKVDLVSFKFFIERTPMRFVQILKDVLLAELQA